MSQIPKNRSDEIIRYHVWASMSVSLVPIPLLDFAAISIVQFNMIRKLSKLYGIRLIKKDKTSLKSLILSVSALADDVAVAGFRKVALPSISASLATSMSKAIPVAGHTIGVASSSVVNGAFTYAIGKMTALHFESGCTFLSLDPQKVEAYYKEMFNEGKKVASEMVTKKGA